MKNTIKEAFARRRAQKESVIATLTHDEIQIKDYLLNNSPLHLRRLLDQAYFYAITSEHRDRDQVVHRSRHSHHIKEAITPPGLSKDEKLIHAYLLDASPLHPRRTLDQFCYSAGDTEARDQDQVVYRYCQRNMIEPKLFMVDQLWLWILGKGDHRPVCYMNLLTTHRSHYHELPTTVATANG